jgi:hypothetical protein
MYMRGVTWSRDSHGLFDYESKSITKQSWMTQEAARVVRQDNEITIVPDVVAAVNSHSRGFGKCETQEARERQERSNPESSGLEERKAP